MEIKKTFEYKMYKSVCLNISFKDEEKYTALIKAAQSDYMDTPLTRFAREVLTQMEAPCS